MIELVKIGIRDYGTNPGKYNFPWCAAWLQRVLNEAAVKHETTLMARSFLSVGVETHDPKLGDIVVLWRKAPNSIWGHAGLYIVDDETGVWVLGGNQDNQVNIKQYPLHMVLGYRRINT